MKHLTLLLIALAYASCSAGNNENEPIADVGVESSDDVTTIHDDASETTADTRIDVDLGPFGGDRPAKVVLPRDWRPDVAYPVVVLLHGIGADSTKQNIFFRTSLLVDELQFVLVLPEGTVDELRRQFWSATENCCDFYGTGVDDATYLIELARDALRRYAGDPARLYFLGHSNGGYMSYRLACDYSSEIAGIASLAGASWVDPARCGEPEPTTVLQVHGTADTVVFYAGRPGLQPSAQEVADRWAARNGCTSGPNFAGSSDFDSAVVGDETRKETWSGCEANTDVALWTMNGSGHIPATGDGFTREILAYLFAHSKP